MGLRYFPITFGDLTKSGGGAMLLLELGARKDVRQMELMQRCIELSIDAVQLPLEFLQLFLVLLASQLFDVLLIVRPLGVRNGLGVRFESGENHGAGARIFRRLATAAGRAPSRR